jgi:hypothetical protein
LHPGYQPAGSYDRPDMKITKPLSRALLRHVAHLSAPSLVAKNPPPALVVQSPPGEGKTASVRALCSREGIDLIISPPNEFAGETENACSDAIERVKTAIVATTAALEPPRPIVWLLDDFDLSSAARLQRTEYTVNAQLLTGALQHILDMGGLRTAQGLRVPMILTGNDFIPLRASLLRPGRARFYEHSVTFEEKCDMVHSLFNPNEHEHKTVRWLVKAYRDEPIAFFAELYARLADASLDAIIDHHGLNIEAIETEIADLHGKFDLSALPALAAQAIRERPTNYLRS